MLSTDVTLHSAGATNASEHPAAPILLAATLYLPDAPPAGSPAGLLPGLVVGHGAGSRRSHHADFCEAAALRASPSWRSTSAATAIARAQPTARWKTT